jgi:hypothetical protein
MTNYKIWLLGAVASAALMSAAPAAFAFDQVDWAWDNVTHEDLNLDIDVTTNIDPTGLVQVEKLQAHFGNITAVSNVSGINNNAAGATDGTIDQTFDAAINYIDGSPANINDTAESATNAISGPPASSFTSQTVGGLTVSLVDQGAGNYGNVDEIGEQANFQINVSGTLAAAGALDAADLPKVENAATAVSNNQSISADVPLYLHDAQFAAGDFNTTCGGDGEGGSCPDALGFLIGAYGVTQVDGELQDLNEHTSIAGLLTVAAATGFIEPAAVSASASVSDILNAYVENSATAVTNNASFSISSDNPANHVVVADLTQWGYANVSAAASVTDVNLNNYTGLGAAGFGGSGDITPIISNSATAVGNNLSIKVGTPDI